MIVDLLLGVGGVAALWVAAGLRVVRQYERGVVFRFGRVQAEVRQPGLTRRAWKNSALPAAESLRSPSTIRAIATGAFLT